MPTLVGTAVASEAFLSSCSFCSALVLSGALPALIKRQCQATEGTPGMVLRHLMVMALVVMAPLDTGAMPAPTVRAPTQAIQDIQVLAALSREKKYSTMGNLTAAYVGNNHPCLTPIYTKSMSLLDPFSWESRVRGGLWGPQTQ